MSNRELVDAAWTEVLSSTISGSEWLNRKTNGYKGKPYNWQATAFGRAKLLLDQVADVPADDPSPPPPSPPSTGTIPAHQVVVQPGGHDAPGDTKCFCWVQHTSPTTQSLGGNHPRSIAWAPGDLYKPGDTVWVLYHWKPEENDGPGRLLNFHTNEHRGGYNPGGVPDLSPIALDWFGSGPDVEGSPGLRLGLEQHPNHHVPLLPYDTVKAAMAPGHPGFDITLAIEVKRPGLIRCWVDGVLKQSQTQHPFYSGQTGYWLIEGSYRWDGIASQVKVRQSAARVGGSLAAALADRPVLFGAYGSKNASGQPGYSRNDLPAYDVSTFRAPAGVS